MEEINTDKKDSNISKSNGNEESDKENNSLLSNSQKNKDSNTNTEEMNNICKDFINEIFSKENERHKRTKSGDELNIVGFSEHTKSKKSELSNNSNKKPKEEYNINSFKITPEKVKYLMEHKKEIINIQKNWKR